MLLPGNHIGRAVLITLAVIGSLWLIGEIVQWQYDSFPKKLYRNNTKSIAVIRSCLMEYGARAMPDHVGEPVEYFRENNLPPDSFFASLNLMDAWNRPLKLSRSAASNVNVEVRSFGANGHDEYGSGDDWIVYLDVLGGVVDHKIPTCDRPMYLGVLHRLPYCLIGASFGLLIILRAFYLKSQRIQFMG
ncbi:MAG: hypothetical protein FLDDKLPJ_03304 [Phycisphaerae bacterium]|nr:hypothetical protein [Phycisphaerae bacterium]